MKVYMAVGEVDYEGDVVLGVYSSQEKAEARVQEYREGKVTQEDVFPTLTMGLVHNVTVVRYDDYRVDEHEVE